MDWQPRYLRVPLKANIKIKSVNKEVEGIKNNQMEILEFNAITKIKGSLNGLNSRMERTEKGVSELEDRSVNIP